MKINLVNISSTSDTELISAAEKICVARRDARNINPLIYGARPNAKEARFRKNKTADTAFALVFESLKSCVSLGVDPEVES